MSDQVKKKYWWQKKYSPNLWTTFFIALTAALIPIFKFGVADDVFSTEDMDDYWERGVSLMLSVWYFVYYVLLQFHTESELFGNEYRPFDWKLPVKQLLIFPVMMLIGMPVTFISYYVFMFLVTLVIGVFGLFLLPFW